MASADRRPKRWITVLAILTTSLAISFIWGRAAVTGGLRISPDSALFMSIANDMNWDGSQRIPTNRAPGYIWLMAAAQRFEPFPDVAAAWLSAVQLFGVLALFGTALARLSGSIGVALLGMICLAALPGHLASHQSALTEPTFALFLIAHVVFVQRWIERKGMSTYTGATACAAGAALTRYTGYFAFATLAALTLLDWMRRRAGLREHILQLFILLWAAIPSATWALRNHALDGTLHGKRRPAVVTLQENITATADTIYTDLGWYLPMAALGAVLLILRHGRPEARATAMYVVFHVACYLVLLLYGLSTSDVDRVNTRYFGPIYPLMLLIAFGALSLAPKFDGRWGAFAWRLAGQAILLATAGLALVSNVRPVLDMAAMFDRGESRVRHLDAGFARSPTAAGIRSWIAKRLDELGEVHVAVLSDPVRPQRGRVLFLRRGALPDFEALRGAAGPGFDYAWTLYRSGREQVLQVHDLPPVRDLDEFLDALRTTAERVAPRPLFVVVDRSTRTQGLLGDAWERLAEIFAGPAERTRESIRPYVIYRLVHKP